MPNRYIQLLLYGGLGNQLFSYSAARRICIRNNLKLQINKTYGYRNDPYNRYYLLDKFRLSTDTLFVDNSPLRKCLPHQYISLTRNINKAIPFPYRFHVFQEHLDFDKRLLDLKPIWKKTRLEGYWQSPLYFDDIRSILHNELLPTSLSFDTSNFIADQLDHSQSVGIHFRFFNPTCINHGDNLPLEYYVAAIKYINMNVSEPSYFIFSDNSVLARQACHAIGLKHYHLIDDSSISRCPVDNLWMLRCCKHKIIANSTFSWWSAYLTPFVPGNLVVAPDFRKYTGVSYWGFEGLILNTWKSIFL